jgi:hypothetical protein
MAIVICKSTTATEQVTMQQLVVFHVALLSDIQVSVVMLWLIFPAVAFFFLARRDVGPDLSTIEPEHCCVLISNSSVRSVPWTLENPACFTVLKLPFPWLFYFISAGKMPIFSSSDAIFCPHSAFSDFLAQLRHAAGLITDS